MSAVPQRKAHDQYVRFRKDLFALGFTMHQKSIYLRWEETEEQGASTARAVRESLPPEGDIAVFLLPDRTMASSSFFHDGDRAPGPEAPPALALF